MLSTYFLLSSIVCDAICELNGKGIFNSTEFSGLLLVVGYVCISNRTILKVKYYEYTTNCKDNANDP